MIDLALYVAVACALLGAWTGNRTAWVLLAYVGLTSALLALDVPFNVFAWATIDLATIAAIIGLAGLRVPPREGVIIALFALAWALYPVPDAWAIYATDLIVSAQLALTLPARKLWERAKRTPLPPREPDDFDLFKARA